MIVSILQLMGFPVAKPVNSRAGEPPPQKPAKGRGGAVSDTDVVQESSARRPEVKAKSGKDSKAVPPKGKDTSATRPSASPVASAAPKGSKPAAKAAVKTAAKPVGKASAPAAGAGKVLPKPASKLVAAKAVKPAAKTVSPASVKPVPAPKVAAANQSTASSDRATARSVSQPVSKLKASVSPAPMPVSPKSAKPAPTVAPLKLKTPVAASPAVAKPAPVAVAPAPLAQPVVAKAGRPSSRLAQLTVPSIAQTIASTAAKASYTQSTPSPVIVPVLPSSIKKDPKLANNWKTTAAADMTDAELMAMPDSEYMSALQLAVFRLKLTKLKMEILNSAGETTEHLREDTSVVPDPADRATIEEEHALELRTRDRERKLLKKIEQSIGRIDAGDYGYCDETGEPIGVGRLLARPTATLSLEAQQRRELKQKMFGD